MPFTPRLTPALRNTYILPTATLSGITKKMYTQPLMSVLDNPSSEIMDPFFPDKEKSFVPHWEYLKDMLMVLN